MTNPQSTDLGAELMAACSRAADKQPSFAGRGIVVCAGGARILTNAYVLVRMLRDTLDCTLPIEIWHMGSMEMPPLIAGLLEGLGCRIVDANEVSKKHPAAIYDGWQLKSYALLHSAFDDTLLLDADQVPLIDPETVFEWPEYRRAGAVFWPDIIELSARNPVWELVGLEPEDIRSWETGQIAVNKSRHWKSLWLVFEFNQRAEMFYDLVYGDKDTFLIAWLMTGAEHAFVPHPPFVDERYLVQRDFAGGGAFQHRTNCKWSLHEAPDCPPGFVHQDTCERYLDDLRKVWNGFVFTPPSRSHDAMETERELILQRAFTCFLGEAPPAEIELLDGHQIGKGRDFHWFNWYVESVAGGCRLVICDRTRPSFVLTRTPDGLWLGNALTAKASNVVLQPRSVQAPIEAGDGHSLVQAFIDAARRGSVMEPLDRDSLFGALKLLERIEPGMVELTVKLAADQREGNPQVAEILEEIVERLRLDTKPDGQRPRDKALGMFGKSGRYNRL